MLPTTPYRIASNEGRTRDLALTKRMLCQLSYRGESVAPGRHSDRLQRLFADCKKKMPPPGIAPGLPAPQAGVLLLYYSGRWVWRIRVSIPVLNLAKVVCYHVQQSPMCVHRDSNPNLILGRDKYYPCTMDACHRRVPASRARGSARATDGDPVCVSPL